jgi:signal transduction histidine kinase
VRGHTVVILALSRFRVANGMEQAVADAFSNRPGLVDAWPGFLGLETFTDTTDPAVFYLATRWTHRAAFHEWHHSAAHRESHRGMPKGLRLDPSETQLVELERLPGLNATGAASFLLDASALVADYMTRTRVVHVARFDLDGHVQSVNAAMADHLGVAIDALEGQTIFTFLTEPDAATVRQRLAERFNTSAFTNLNFCDATGMPFTLSTCLAVHSDGCLLIGEPVFEHDERLQRELIEVNVELAALARTRQRSTVTEQQARHRAESGSRAKDDALAVIGHELRQPLNAMMAALSVTKLNPAGAARGLQILERQVGYMTGLVEDLLYASQVMRGAAPLTREHADLGALVRDVADGIEPAMLERGQQLTIEIPEMPLMVDVGTTQIRQVVVNLLTNAMKYTPVGGSIVVSVEAANDEVCRVRVRDTGQGIAPDALERVFELFVRESSGGNGLGIGLAVARRLVELHHGTITVSSEGVGRGSEFVVTLPSAHINQRPAVAPSGRSISAT